MGMGGMGGMDSMAGGVLGKAGAWLGAAGMVTGMVSQVVGIATQISGLMMQKKQMKLQEEQYRQQMEMAVFQLCDKICVTEWSQWSSCTNPADKSYARCGTGGQAKRTRKAFKGGKCGNHECRHHLDETAICNQGCPNGGMPRAINDCACPKQFAGACCDSEIICEYPGKPRNGLTEGSTPARYGGFLQFFCNEGYGLIGKDYLVCKDNGWNGVPVASIPRCAKVKCPEPPGPENGRMINSGQGEYVYGDEAVFMCDEGYDLRGPERMRCLIGGGGEGEEANGRWAGFTPLCMPVNCGYPDYPLNGYMEGTDFTLGNKVTFSCENGFRLVGSAERTCLPSGHWTGHPPTCNPRMCEEPYLPRHTMLVRPRDIYYFGVSVNFECEEGYRINGSTSARCILDEDSGALGSGGKWNQEAPRCTAQICGDPGQPENGAKDGTVYYFPHVLTFSCFPGYIMFGDPQITCEANAKWSGPVPQCAACPLDFYTDTLSGINECIPCPENMHTITEASTSLQQCICNHGYTGLPGGPCEEIRCPILQSPEFGSMSECDNTYESVCEFDCQDGFIMEKGSSRRKCDETGQWTGADAVCSACPLDTYKEELRICVPCPMNSLTEGVGNMKDGCLCRLGYEGPPGGPCTDFDECSVNAPHGPCSDVCRNTDGFYVCECSIPGQVIDELDGHTCIVNKTCRNLTMDDAPANGGLVCHWYYEEASQQCTVKCNPGYEFPARINNYETCGASTGFHWTHEEREETIEPCVEEFFPDYRMEADSAYFVVACKDLSVEQQDEVKIAFAEMLTAEGICRNRKNMPVCNMEDVGIICGRTVRRRKRDVEEEVDEVDFRFNIKALKIEENPQDCPRICAFLRIPRYRCKMLCFGTYRRYLKAAVDYTGQKLERLFKDKAKVTLNAVQRLFEPKDDGLQHSELIVDCPLGMRVEPNTTLCVPCHAGTYALPDQTDCVPCAENTYQPEAKSTTCLPCPAGTHTQTNRSTKCKPCPPGRFGLGCTGMCSQDECVNGKCNPITGACECLSGWTGPSCEVDIQSCLEGSCFPGVVCLDVPAPGMGYKCGKCPQGTTGDGFFCDTPLTS